MCRPLQKTMLHRGLGDPTGQVLLRHPTTGKWRSGESEGWRFVLVGEGPGSETGNFDEFWAMLWDVWEVQTYRKCEVSSSLSAPKLFFLMSKSQRSTVRIAHSKCPANWHRRRSSILTQGQIALLHTLCQWEMLQDVMVFTMVLLVTWWFTPVSGFYAQFSV